VNGRRALWRVRREPDEPNILAAYAISRSRLTWNDTLAKAHHLLGDVMSQIGLVEAGAKR
jgi:hypothetical protein